MSYNSEVKRDCIFYDEYKRGIKPGKAQQIKPNSSRKYDLWLDDIERQNWSKLFLEV